MNELNKCLKAKQSFHLKMNFMNENLINIFNYGSLCGVFKFQIQKKTIHIELVLIMG
ncbi:hypothetical protein SRABI27_04045 [Pedobacter sp. Bi27]|nr:hypothetical protein SRABI27_04045 [Pedobacter sp. Bi27]